MEPNKPKNRKSAGKAGRKRNATLPSWKVPTRDEIGTINLNGGHIEAVIRLRAKLAPALSADQKDEISKAAGVYFLADDDWERVEAAMDELAWHSKTSREGIGWTAVQAEVEEFKRRAIRLHCLMCDTEAGKIAAGKISWFLALGRAGGKSAVQQLLSDLVQAADRASAYMTTEQDQSRGSLSPFADFVGRIEHIFCERGVTVSAPKPKDYERARSSQFQEFIRALLVAVPNADPSIDTSHVYVAALMSRIATALAEWRRSRPKQEP